MKLAHWRPVFFSVVFCSGLRISWCQATCGRMDLPLDSGYFHVEKREEITRIINCRKKAGYVFMSSLLCFNNSELTGRL